MRIEISDDMSKLTVLAEGLEQQTILGAAQSRTEPIEVASFDRPTLLTDSFRIGRLPSGIRDTVLNLYESYPRTVSYRGVEVSWSPTIYPRVWCPSIDTIFLANALTRYTASLTSFAEIGCASGFLTKLALHQAGNLTHATATDINVEAIRCTNDTLMGHGKRAIVNLSMPSIDAPTLGLNGPYDLIVTNPPYIPRPSEKHDNPYEGLDVLRKLSQEAKQSLTPGGKILINISSLSGEEPLDWFREQGFSICPQETLRVPLKVNPITSGITKESQEWLQYLIDTGRLEEDDAETSGYRYWHTLQILEIINQEEP